MASNVIGIFTNTSQARRALEELEDLGVTADDVSIIVKDSVVAEEMTTQTTPSEVIAEGAATGGLIGGLVGLLAGLTAITIPGLGALFIGGPLAAALGLTGAAATTLSGAVTGALAGGLVGGLVGLGIPEEKAKGFEERIRQGDVLIAVDTSNVKEDLITNLMKNNGAEEVSAYKIA